MESIVLETCSSYMPGRRDPESGEEFPGRWRHNNLMLCLLSTTRQLQNLDHEIPSIHHEISIHCIYVRMTSLPIRQLMDLLMWLGAPPLITCFFNLTRNNRGGSRDANFIKAQCGYICVGLLRKRCIFWDQLDSRYSAVCPTTRNFASRGTFLTPDKRN